MKILIMFSISNAWFRRWFAGLKVGFYVEEGEKNEEGWCVYDGVEAVAPGEVTILGKSDGIVGNDKDELCLKKQ